jgi:hypothetical protein
MKLRLLALALLVIGFNGCTVMQPLPDDLPERIHVWMQNDEYGQALRMLDRVRSDHPRYVELIRMKPQVRQQAQAFAQRIAGQARQAWGTDDWQTAYDKLQYGLQRYPQSELLQRTNSEFEQKRQTHLQRLQQQLDINKAKWLARNMPIQREMAEMAPDEPEVIQHQQQLEAQRDEVYKRLVTYGVDAMKQEQWQLAHRCLTLAEGLKPTGALSGALKRVSAKLNIEEQKKTQLLSADTRHWLGKAREELAQDNIKQALHSYRQIDKAQTDRSTVRAFKQQLDKRIEQDIEEGIETGRKFYTQGKIERALAVWHSLQELNPHHEKLNAHIARAEKVLKKIKRLREDQIVLPPNHSDNHS